MKAVADMLGRRPFQPGRAQSAITAGRAGPIASPGCSSSWRYLRRLVDERPTYGYRRIRPC